MVWYKRTGRPMRGKFRREAEFVIRPQNKRLLYSLALSTKLYGAYLNPKALALNGLTGFPIAGSVASRFRNAALMPYLGLEYVLIVPEKWNEPQMCRICGFFFDKTASPNNDGNKIFNLMRSNYASCNSRNPVSRR